MGKGAAMLFLLSCLAFLCQEMVFASVSDVKGMSHENLDDILKIPGMEIDHDELYFKGEKVKSINGFPSDNKEESEESEEAEPVESVESEEPEWVPSRRYPKHRYGHDILNNVKSVTPIKNIQEITKMLPVKSIEEIKSIKEIESIEEIKDKLARNFIRNHGLKNLINDEGHYPNMEQPVETDDLYQLRRQMMKDSKQCQLLKEKVAKKQQEIDILEEIEDQHCEAAQNELEEYRTLKEKIEAALNSKVASIEPIKSIEEV